MSNIKTKMCGSCRFWKDTGTRIGTCIYIIPRAKLPWWASDSKRVFFVEQKTSGLAGKSCGTWERKPDDMNGVIVAAKECHDA